MTLHRENGFTLIELLIVVAIIGILASIALPATHVSYVAKSTVIRSISAAKPLQMDVMNYYSQHQHFPNNSRELNSENLSALKADRVTDVTILKKGQIIITYDSHLNFSYPNHYSFDTSDKTLILVPTFNNGSISWDICSQGTVPTDFRPPQCHQKF